MGTAVLVHARVRVPGVEDEIGSQNILNGITILVNYS
jgi:hypothetical protein